MSDIRERLVEAGADGSVRMAERLASEERVQILAGRVGTGRRRRGVASVAGVAAGVVVVAFGLWSVLPGAARATWDPASSEGVNFEYSLDDFGDFPLGTTSVDLLRDHVALACGGQFDLEPGVTIQDSSATTRGARIEASLTPLVSDEADVDDSDDRLVWDATWGGRGVNWIVFSLLVDDGIIVGTGGEAENSGDETGYANGGSRNYVPVGGSGCADGQVYSATDTAGVPILVAQAYANPMMTMDTTAVEDFTDEDWTALDEQTVLLATVVLDPRDPQADEGEPATLTAPSDGIFQAFSVEAPAASCNALGDARAAGAPGSAAVASFLDLGDEVATVTDVLNTQAPFADVPPDSWMAGADAWLVVDGGDDPSMVHLDWRTDGDGWSVLEIGDQSSDPLRPEGCDLPEAFTGSGATFLVLDAVAPALARYGEVWGESTVGTQTWIYLGDA